MNESKFNLVSNFRPCGDQTKAIETICKNIDSGEKNIVLLGVTGSGKTFTMANIISNINRPALIMAPNKTLAAQLYEEMKDLFPENSVSYFVSYYDYFQPEAYLPASDTYIEKDSAINQEIDKLRHLATQSLLTRRDVIIVASVSCIYGIGSPESYASLSIDLKINDKLRRSTFVKKLIDINYTRTEDEFVRGTYRVRGDTVDLFPIHEDEVAYRIEFFGDLVENIYYFDPLSNRITKKIESIKIYPSSHFSTPIEIVKRAIKEIQKDLKIQIDYFNKQMKLKEAKRIEERTYYDIEMMEEFGYCKGIENYSRYLTGRETGSAPPTLFEYFPSDFLLFIDESHITVPQIGGMYKGDRSRKQNLVEYGFRLPSALDNRPLNFKEFENMINQVIFVSATPADYELNRSKVIEQIIRPTGLVDPLIEIRESKFQVDDLFEEIKNVILKKEKVLVTTLTKKMAESLTDYYLKLNLRVRYLHSDISTLERIEIIKDLRESKFDVLIGINLLREGIDIPEVSLVAILDADKEGFLRSYKSLIQIIGRASRNVNGKVILYADKLTESIKQAIYETKRRRELQIAYNKEHRITPQTIVKSFKNSLIELLNSGLKTKSDFKIEKFNSVEDINSTIMELSLKMKEHAKALEFEKASEYRDQISKLKLLILELG